MNEQSNYIDFLYKFRNIDSEGHTEEIFTKNRLYFSTRKYFNDPFDCRPKQSFSASEDKIKEYFLKRVPKFFPALTTRQQIRAKTREIMKQKKYKNNQIQELIEKESISKIIDKVGICCFSKRPDNILMWSHYADKHRGICLQFEGKPSTPFFYNAQIVEYQKNLPVINPFIDEKEPLFYKTFLKKSCWWEYEEEWRIIIPRIGSTTFEFPPEYLKGVILGSNISEKNEKNVITWAKEIGNPINVFKAFLKEEEYGIDIRPLA